MSKKNVKLEKLKFFEGYEIRREWGREKEEWYYSVVDVIWATIESEDYETARKYWNKLKQRLKEEGNESVTKCHQLKMKAADGKNRLTDVATVEGLFRILQSVPSKKIEPIKMWLAKTGNERIEEIIDPEIAIQRGVDTYKKKGYDDAWIARRIQTIQMRRELTETWADHGIQKGAEFAILTDDISRAWSGMSTREYKDHKGVKKGNLRDNMTGMELALNMLAEETTKELTKDRNPRGLNQNREVAKEGGGVAGNARAEIEFKLGRTVISSQNAQTLFAKKENTAIE